MLKLWMIFPLFFLAPSEAYSKTKGDSCLLGQKNRLIKGDFSGPLVCSPKMASFSLVGRIKGTGLSVYDYRYKYRASKGGIVHGGQKIILFDVATYVGQYNLSPPPYVQINVSGAIVTVKSDKTGEIFVIDFSKGPPDKAFIDGDFRGIFK